MLDRTKQLRLLIGLRNLRNEVDTGITYLEEHLQTIAQTPIKTRKTRRHLRRASRDLLKLFEKKSYYTREDAIEKSWNTYGDLYSSAAVTCTLNRLEMKGYLRFDGVFFVRTSKKVT